MLLDADSMEEMKRKHDNLYVVLALCAMNPDFDHNCDQFWLVKKFLQWIASWHVFFIFAPQGRLETHLSILNLQQWCLLEEEGVMGIVEDVVVETRIQTFDAHIVRSGAPPKTNATT